MSYTTLKAAFGPEGSFVKAGEYGNAHGSAAFVWDVLCTAFNIRALESSHSPGKGIPPNMTDNWQALWHFHMSPDGKAMSAMERCVLMTTYDRALVRREDMLVVADAYDSFVHRYKSHIAWSQIERTCVDGRRWSVPRDFDSLHLIGRCHCQAGYDHKDTVVVHARVCSLKAQAADIRKAHAEGALVIGWHQMSVSDDPFWIRPRPQPNPEKLDEDIDEEGRPVALADVKDAPIAEDGKPGEFFYVMVPAELTSFRKLLYPAPTT